MFSLIARVGSFLLPEVFRDGRTVAEKVQAAPIVLYAEIFNAFAIGYVYAASHHFTALAEGEYLRYLPDSGRLLALARQPAGTSRSDALAFETGEEALAMVALDPSRGAILSLVVQTPPWASLSSRAGV